MPNCMKRFCVLLMTRLCLLLWVECNLECSWIFYHLNYISLATSQLTKTTNTLKRPYPFICSIANISNRFHMGLRNLWKSRNWLDNRPKTFLWWFCVRIREIFWQQTILIRYVSTTFCHIKSQYKNSHKID